MNQVKIVSKDDALLELRRRKQLDGLRYYEPVNEKADAFHKSPKKRRVIVAGNRGGKTETGVVEDLYYATGRHPYRRIETPNEGWILTSTFEKARDVIWPKIKQYLPYEFYRKPPSWKYNVLELGNGSIIRFKSWKQGVEAQAGSNIRYVHIDEEGPERIHNEIMMRLIDQGGDAWNTFSPLAGMRWFKRLVEKNTDEYDVFSWSIYENKHLTREEIDRAEKNITTEEERRARLYGEWALLEGDVFPEFNKGVHIVPQLLTKDLDTEWTYVVGIDTGRRFAAVWIAIDFTGHFIVFDSYYSKDKVVAVDMEAIKAKNKFYGISPMAVVDPASQIKPDVKLAFNYNVADGIRDRDGRRIAAASLMHLCEDGKPRLTITENNDVLIEQVEEWGFLKQRSNSVDIEHNLSLKVQPGFDVAVAMTYGVTCPAILIPVKNNLKKVRVIDELVEDALKSRREAEEEEWPNGELGGNIVII